MFKWRDRSPFFRRCGTVALFALMLSSACSLRSPQKTSAPSRLEQGTGTRAKGEEAPIAATAPAPAKNAGPAKPEVPSPAPANEPAPAATAAASAPAADEFGMIGLAAGAQGFGSGQGRLGGSGQGRMSGSHRSSVAARSPVKRGLAIATAAPGDPLAPAPATPPPDFNTEAYSRVQDNPFLLVKDSPLSTFSVDVDTASYSNMRRFVQRGTKPPADSIRVEEWVNYFSYDDPPPPAGEPVEVASEVTDCPWAPGHRLLRVALGTQPIAQDAVPPRNLVFLIDVSGSMSDENKLPLLKRGLALLARQLRPEDTVSMVVYAGASGLALPPTSGADQARILVALGSLESGGSTNGAEGIQLAYKMAESQFKKGGINRVILASDGDFNVGITSEGDLERLIEEKRKSGVFLTVLGFGEGNLKDATMEKLADKGNGQYAYIDDLAEARKVLVHQAGATLVTVAKDVKLQLEFNPAKVKSYRLVGYENRVLAARDFNDDEKDAGEMGAGHHVTAFYELVTADGQAAAGRPSVDPLKYQNERSPSAAAANDELVTVKIRYKPPAGDTSLLMTRVVKDRTVPIAQTTANLRFGAAVAQYALTLRGAPGMTRERLEAARALAAGAYGSDPRGERREFVALMDKAVGL